MTTSTNPHPLPPWHQTVVYRLICKSLMGSVSNNLSKVGENQNGLLKVLKAYVENDAECKRERIQWTNYLMKCAANVWRINRHFEQCLILFFAFQDRWMRSKIFYWSMFCPEKKLFKVWLSNSRVGRSFNIKSWNANAIGPILAGSGNFLVDLSKAERSNEKLKINEKGCFNTGNMTICRYDDREEPTLRSVNACFHLQARGASVLSHETVRDTNELLSVYFDRERRNSRFFLGWAEPQRRSLFKTIGNHSFLFHAVLYNSHSPSLTLPRCLNS